MNLEDMAHPHGEDSQWSKRYHLTRGGDEGKSHKVSLRGWMPGESWLRVGRANTQVGGGKRVEGGGRGWIVIFMKIYFCNSGLEIDTPASH